MKVSFLFSKFFALLVLFTLFSISCKDKTKTTPKEETKKEISSVAYQCPMDCEKGKTYSEKGSCPVCKMDLKQIGHSADCSCTSHDGKCQCKEGECNCSKCSEHNAPKCDKGADAKCSHEGKCKEGECKKENCKKVDCKEAQSNTNECTKHIKDFKKDAACTCADKKDCKCEEGKCKCPKCPTHS